MRIWMQCRHNCIVWRILFEYVKINSKNFIFPDMGAKMTAKILYVKYRYSAFRHRDKWSVRLCEMKDVEFGYVKINNYNCIFSKMTTEKTATNLNLMYESKSNVCHEVTMTSLLTSKLKIYVKIAILSDMIEYEFFSNTSLSLKSELAYIRLRFSVTISAVILKIRQLLLLIRRG